MPEIDIPHIELAPDDATETLPPIMTVRIAALALTLSLPVSALDITRFIDATGFEGIYTPGLEFDTPGQGELDYTRLRLGSFLSKPFNVTKELLWVPYFSYKYSDVDYQPGLTSNALTNSVFDDSLHEVAISQFFVYDNKTRWFHMAYVDTRLGTDFDHVTSRDFFLSAAIASGYKINDCLIIGAGVFGNDLTNDPWFIAAPGFVWMPTEDWLITYYGPKFVCRRELSDRTRVGFEAAWNGGQWNIETTPGNANKLDLRSLRTGFYWRQNLFGELWMTVGAGYTFANEVTLSTPGGNEVARNLLGEMESAPYFQLGFSINRW